MEMGEGEIYKFCGNRGRICNMCNWLGEWGWTTLVEGVETRKAVNKNGQIFILVYLYSAIVSISSTRERRQ